MSKFNSQANAFFKSNEGAYSEVTNREATGDKSVTIDRNEKSVLFSLYPANSFVRAGGASSGRDPGYKKVNVYDPKTRKSALHELAIKYPKSSGNELRLYFRRGTGFYPTDADSWFIFVRSGEKFPFIGSLPKVRLGNLLSGAKHRLAFEAAYALDDEDDLYQKAVLSPTEQQEAQIYTGSQYPRNARMAANYVKKVGYICQYNSIHPSFISGVTGEQYVEVHHLVPISKSDDFNNSLDVVQNLVVLCPNCHRAIHLSENSVKKAYIDKFFEERKESLEQVGISLSNAEQLYKYYGINTEEPSITILR